MLFSDILGLSHIKTHLTTTADRGRIPHAQLFVGAHGSGPLPMAIAYAQYILCHNSGGENTDGNLSCNKKCASLEHPDLHFCYPVANNKRIKTNARVTDYMKEWRSFVHETPYGGKYDWDQFMGFDNKNAMIKLDDAKAIAKTLSLKSYEGGHKVMIIWHAELMNARTANYLLKLIEEPPDKTVFILITDDASRLLDTIYSRCQKLEFPPLGEKNIQAALAKTHGIAETNAQKIAFQADGSYARALQIINQNDDEAQFEQWFVDWVRTAFSAKGNKAAIIKLLAWSDKIAKTNRETQKQFLAYCLNFMRQALLKNYKADSLVFIQPTTKNFKLDRFAPFIHGNNIADIARELETAIYHINRNGNSRIILSDLSIKLTRLLHRKPTSLSK